MSAGGAARDQGRCSHGFKIAPWRFSTKDYTIDKRNDFPWVVPALTAAQPLRLHPQGSEPAPVLLQARRVSLGHLPAALSSLYSQLLFPLPLRNAVFLILLSRFLLSSHGVKHKRLLPNPLQRHRHLCLISELPSCSSSSSPKFNISPSQAAVSLRCLHSSSPN